MLIVNSKGLPQDIENAHVVNYLLHRKGQER